MFGTDFLILGIELLYVAFMCWYLANIQLFQLTLSDQSFKLKDKTEGSMGSSQFIFGGANGKMKKTP